MKPHPHPVRTFVRDGRIGRDRSADPEHGHPLLLVLDAPGVYEQDDLIALPDGTTGVVIGSKWEIEIGERVQLTVFVGDQWPGPQA